MISSYETLRNHVDVLDLNEIDLVICDEAHRLKNDRTKTARVINDLPAPMRLLLSGTPIQNDLDEFFALITLANPAVVGTQQEFHKQFAKPIQKGRDPDADTETKENGQKCLEELSALTDHFILRRTNRLNARFLPPKILLCVFLRMAKEQESLYETFLNEHCGFINADSDDEGKSGKKTDLSKALVNVNALMKIASHPSLLAAQMQKYKPPVQKLIKGLKTGGAVKPEQSCKILFVFHLLTKLRADPEGERVCIISNWTQTLGIVEQMCKENKWPVHRLDGSVGIRKRHQLVSSFCDPNNPNAFVFLLSSKAGGCGINLIGASRLVMLDPDWNPANDKQAMGRIWREGQKRTCYIYRLFATGTIDEKQLQRQVCKDGLAQSVVDAQDLKDSLHPEQIKDLFNYRPETSCDTHDSLNCTRCDDGSCEPKAPFQEDDLNAWGHGERECAPDPIVQSAECTKVFYGRVEFTPAEIARLEEEERVLREGRKDPIQEKIEELVEPENDPPLQSESEDSDKPLNAVKKTDKKDVEKESSTKADESNEDTKKIQTPLPGKGFKKGKGGKKGSPPKGGKGNAETSTKKNDAGAESDNSASSTPKKKGPQGKRAKKKEESEYSPTQSESDESTDLQPARKKGTGKAKEKGGKKGKGKKGSPESAGVKGGESKQRKSEPLSEEKDEMSGSQSEQEPPKQGQKRRRDDSTDPDIKGKDIVHVLDDSDDDSQKESDTEKKSKPSPTVPLPLVHVQSQCSNVTKKSKVIELISSSEED